MYAHFTANSTDDESLSTPMQNLVLLTQVGALKPVIVIKNLCFELFPSSLIKRKLNNLIK